LTTNLQVEKADKVKTLLHEWIKKNSVMLINAASLIGTTVVTGAFGFAYWWIAARQYPLHAVGLASAAVSAMTLLGAICILGLGTLLIGELPRHPGEEASLISAALILVGGVGACSGIIFMLVVPLVSTAFLPFSANVGGMLLFTAGVSLTAIINVLDAALIGLLQGTLQFWRNALFAAAKLVILVLAAFWLVKVGQIIYGTWVLGIVLSLVPLAGIVVVKVGRSGRSILPNWTLLRRLRSTALEHHALNLILQFPATALPVLVTIILSATTNAWFYVSWMISGLVFIASYALTTVLYAINPNQVDELMHKIRVTLGLALITSLFCNCLLLFGAAQILALFGHNYAQQAAWCLRILGLGAFPMIIIDHYMAVSRIHRKVAQIALPIATVGCVLELGMAALGAHFGGLVGLSLGWDAALCVQAVVMFPTVYRSAFPARTYELSLRKAQYKG
jgi:O-antigen/teichoic acid export membrane protein